MTWQIGDTSRKYEVGQGGPTTVSTGAGDHGGVSYGTYQLSSKMGTVAKFVQMMGYASYFKGAVPGTSLFSSLWIKAPQSHPNFGADQHEFIRKTHYQPQIDMLKEHDVDLTQKGPAVQDAVWSTSVQFGPGTTLILKALSEKEVSEMSDKAIVSAIQDYKIKNNDSLFKSSSGAIRASTLRRAQNEKDDLIRLADSKGTSKDNGLLNGIAQVFDAIAEVGEKS